MSLKTYFIIVLFASIFGIASCEDKKKTTVVKTETTPIVEKDTVMEKKPSEKKYPLITNKNVESFLTEYGESNPETKVRITTQHGEIDIELFKETPLHRANFIYLVKQKYFNGTFFHRIVPNFIIQGGNSDNVATPKKRAKIGNDYLIPAEINPNRDHSYGTISGAKEYRENPDKQTAPFEFFIFLGPKTSTSHLNGNYTIFGKVTKGMDIVEKIANLPSDDGEWPQQNVYIEATVLQ